MFEGKFSLIFIKLAKQKTRKRELNTHTGHHSLESNSERKNISDVSFIF